MTNLNTRKANISEAWRNHKQKCKVCDTWIQNTRYINFTVFPNCPAGKRIWKNLGRANAT